MKGQPSKSKLDLSFFFLMNPSRCGDEGGAGMQASDSSASQIRVLREKSTIHDSLHVSCWAFGDGNRPSNRILATATTLCRSSGLSATPMSDQNLTNDEGGSMWGAWWCVSFHMQPFRLGNVSGCELQRYRAVSFWVTCVKTDLYFWI